MAISSNFFAASYPEPWQILGVKLRPFSLGHYIKLSRLGCSFVSESQQTASLADLLLGVVVCSMPTEVDQEADPFWQWLTRKTGNWRWKIYRVWQRMRGKKVACPSEYDAFLWGKRVGEIDLPERVKMFGDYMAACSAMPAYVEEHQTTPPKASGAHWAQSVLACLVSKCNYQMRDALNVPMSRALADFLKQAETDGAVRILPEEAFA